MSRPKTLKLVSMFGCTNSKELLLRARTAGIGVSDDLFDTFKWRSIQDTAVELERSPGVKVVGENVVAKDDFMWSLEGGFDVKLQSTIQPLCFVTLPYENPPLEMAALVGDLCSSGLWRVV